MTIKARFRRSRDLQKDTTTSLATTETKNGVTTASLMVRIGGGTPVQSPGSCGRCQGRPLFLGYEIGLGLAFPSIQIATTLKPTLELLVASRWISLFPDCDDYGE